MCMYGGNLQVRHLVEYLFIDFIYEYVYVRGKTTGTPSSGMAIYRFDARVASVWLCGGSLIYYFMYWQIWTL